MQREPFLGLLHAVIMELMVYAAGAKRLEQVPPDIVRKLALVDGDIDELHGKVLAEMGGQDKRRLRSPGRPLEGE